MRNSQLNLFYYQAPRAKTPQPSYSKGDSDLDNHRAEGDWFNTYGDDRSKGGPFSALTPSMWPARGIDGHGDGKHEFTEDEDEVQYDEFGFRYLNYFHYESSRVTIVLDCLFLLDVYFFIQEYFQFLELSRMI